MNIKKKAIILVCLIIGVFLLVGTYITLRIYYLRKNCAKSIRSISGIYTDFDNTIFEFRQSKITLFNSKKIKIDEAYTLNEGKFNFFILQPDTYYIQFSKLGAPDVWYGGGEGEPIILKDSDIFINFQYPQGFSITGTYTNSDGKNLSVRDNFLLYNSNKECIARTGSTDIFGNDGIYAFYGLQPGIYFINFNKSGSPSIWYGGGEGEPITIEDSNIILNIKYPKGLNIAGLYTNSDGGVLLESGVNLFNSQKIKIAETYTVNEDAFIFSDLQSGTYFINFYKSGAPDVWYGGVEGEPVILGDSDISINFQYPQGFNITGIYNDSDNNIIKFEKIHLFNSQKFKISEVATGKDGSFIFPDLQNGTYFIKFTKPMSPDVWYGGGDGEPIIIKNSNITSNFQYPQGFRITINNSFFTGANIYNSQSELIAYTDWFSSSEDTGNNSTLTFSGLQPGVYYIQFDRTLIWYGGKNGKPITIKNSNININYNSIMNVIYRFYFDPINIFEIQETAHNKR